jgi:hypothetical protein
MTQRILLVDDETAKKTTQSISSLVAPRTSANLALAQDGTITIQADSTEEQIVVGSSVMGGVTLSPALFSSVQPGRGKRIVLVGNSNTSPITILNSSPASSKQAILKEDAVLGLGKTISLVYIETLDVYVETSRSI